ncbi:DHA2 family efflux MFS transporter permease subunit [Nakamurella endophytica]|uniref:MFS transporter n=1 Tax=Nakamurella endophytica TaxID=1748367 RepID=A0A917WF43_9ACTN|nr:DHA2 family efflux MFS transporter permease subunit [Nakamurella endophytica]GGL97256.1 MFS transporter [Nakamurella endophytica]
MTDRTGHGDAAVEPAAGGGSDGGAVAFGTRRGRGVLWATVLGSGVAQLDATVVTVALPRIGTDLDAGLVALQWTVNAYTLTLSGLLLLGGSLGDRLGRRRVFLFGVLWFTVASIGCAAAPTAAALVALRALQGVGAALLTPGSLAILQAVFRPADRATAVGAWSGLGGVASAIGPVLGGLLVGLAGWGWRLAFLINVPLAAVVVLLAVRFVPETRDEQAGGRVDVGGTVLAALGLAGVVLGLTDGPAHGWGPVPVVAVAAGVLLLAGFVALEGRLRHPLMPLSLWRDREFAAANLVTLAVYAALSGALFLLPVQLQRVLGYTPVQAGTAVLPITAVMLLLSARMGRWAARIGPRLPMTVGPLVAGTGLALLARVGPGSGFLGAVLPALLVFALGLSTTVAPLTATVLAAAPQHWVGIASAVNNDVARVAGLLAVAVLPGLAGLTPEAYQDPASLSAAFRHAVLIAGALCAAGGLLAALTIRNPLATPEPVR